MYIRCLLQRKAVLDVKLVKLEQLYTRNVELLAVSKEQRCADTFLIVTYFKNSGNKRK